MGIASVALLVAAVLAGASMQRLTGLGFALVSSPFLVIVAGPHDGVVLANLLSLATNLIVLVQLRGEVNVRRALTLAVPAMCAVPLGAWVAGRLSTPVLEIGIGTVVLLALVVVTALRRVRLPSGPAGTVSAGAASGFMNVTAGVGGPAITLYVVSTGWEHSEFVASIQLYFALVNATSLAAKGFSTGIGVAGLGICAAALIGGALIGKWLTYRVSPDRARQVVLVLAYAGGAAAVVKGVLAS